MYSYILQLTPQQIHRICMHLGAPVICCLKLETYPTTGRDKRGDKDRYKYFHVNTKDSKTIKQV